MSDDDRESGRGAGESEGASGDPGRLPPELRSLDEALRDIRFDPRSELEDEVVASVSHEDVSDGRGETPAVRSPDRGGRGRTRRALRVAALLALMAGAGVLGHLLLRGGGDEPTPPAAVEDVRSAGEEWAIRWGPDARVLALGSAGTVGGGSGAHALRCRRIGDRLGCRSTSPGPARFATARGPAVLRDFCCLDYDGGEFRDDGVRVVAGQGEAVVSFWIYEDLDGTGSFSNGDLLRTVVDGDDGSGGDPGTAGSVRRLDRCCAELDGGPKADDGLFVLAGDREQVALALLYEDVTGDGRLSPGDRLRALRSRPLSGSR